MYVICWYAAKCDICFPETTITKKNGKLSVTFPQINHEY